MKTLQLNRNSPQASDHLGFSTDIPRAPPLILALHNLRRMLVGSPPCCENTADGLRDPIPQNPQNLPAIMQQPYFSRSNRVSASMTIQKLSARSRLKFLGSQQLFTFSPPPVGFNFQPLHYNKLAITNLYIGKLSAQRVQQST